MQDGYNPKYHYYGPTALDNLIHQKKVPVMLAVLVQHGGGDGPGSQRGMEYDTVSDKYTMFIETEVLPRIERDYKVRFTKDPEGRATMGGSSGAACALTMAWIHPELYRRVLSYSGLRRSGARLESQISLRRVGVSLDADSEQRAQAAAHLVSRQRARQRRHARGVDAWQLGAREPAAVGGAEGEGLPAQVRVRGRRAAHRRERGVPDASRCAHMAMARLWSEIILHW